MSTRQRHVWVVMSNDFPDSVFTSETAADEYCTEANRLDREASVTIRRQRIYYRWYKLVVQKS